MILKREEKAHGRDEVMLCECESEANIAAVSVAARSLGGSGDLQWSTTE